MCFIAKSANDKEVVIKKFRPGIFKKNEKKNIYEAVILSRLKDKRIPELLGVINQKRFYCFVLEYKHGQTLKELIFKYEHKFTNEEFYNIGNQLIKIIKYLHENSVVHRDIRISNEISALGFANRIQKLLNKLSGRLLISSYHLMSNDYCQYLIL